MNESSDKSRFSPIGVLVGLGGPMIDLLDYIGGVWLLLLDTVKWSIRAAIFREVRFGFVALCVQVIRVGNRSLFIIGLVSFCIGLILAMQMSPPLDEYGSREEVATIISVAVLRELGPLIAAIVLTGFAGAAIAAELGTMKVGEEIEALESMALDPVRFLVVPRVLAAVIAMVVLAVFADIVTIGGGWMIAVTMLDVPSAIYIDKTIAAVEVMDFMTGVFKGGVFGLLIGLIACYNGLRVSGGAAGVGHATTITVVHSVVSIIFADLIFTGIFYALGWN